MIVGSGIVGCYLGRILGDQEIWERNDRLIEKPCSSLLSKTGLFALDFEYEDCILNEIRGARFFSDKKEFSVEKKSAQAFVLDRLKLQKELVEEAKDEGCKVRYGKAWKGEKDKFVIGADGAVSAVAGSMGVKRKYIHAYQIKAELKKKMEPDFVELYFGQFAPGFFGWRIPFDERHVEIGLGVSQGNVKEKFDGFVKRFEIKKIDKVQSALIPLFDSEQRTVMGNTALVGDAAGQVKATTGGGIIFGCKCAEVLADAVERKDLGYYEKQWRIRYGKDLKLHLLARRFLDRTDYNGLFSKIKDNKVDEFIERYGDMDHPAELAKQLIKKPAFWPYLPKFFFASL